MLITFFGRAAKAGTPIHVRVFLQIEAKHAYICTDVWTKYGGDSFSEKTGQFSWAVSMTGSARMSQLKPTSLLAAPEAHRETVCQKVWALKPLRSRVKA